MERAEPRQPDEARAARPGLAFFARNIGKGQGAPVSLCERKSRPALLGKVPRKCADEVGGVVARLLRPKARRAHTPTPDNGLGFAGHRSIAEALNAKCHFAHPDASRRRETETGYTALPKGTGLAAVSERDITRIMDRQNNRRGNALP